VPELGLGMWVIDPAFVFNVLEDNGAVRKGEMFGGMQVCPFDMAESEFRFDQLECKRTNIDIQRAVEITLEVQAASLEEGSLPVQGSVGIIL